jgi:hypothetical protein
VIHNLELSLSYDGKYTHVKDLQGLRFGCNHTQAPLGDNIGCDNTQAPVDDIIGCNHTQATQQYWIPLCAHSLNINLI